MTREDFTQQLLLGHSVEETAEALEFFDKEAGYDVENESISTFINRSKNFITLRLVTPYGDFPIAIDKKAVREVMDWVETKTRSYGVGLREMIRK